MRPVKRLYLSFVTADHIWVIIEAIAVVGPEKYFVVSHSQIKAAVAERTWERMPEVPLSKGR